jgi:hypothetical protein
MAPYQYCPLDTSKQEIRVLHLQPGGRDDPIRVTIEHVPFNHCEDEEPGRISEQDLKSLQKILPEEWEIKRTFEGRPLFCCRTKDNELSHTSWQPPHVVPGDYKLEEMQTRGVKAGFEAVSYSWGISNHIHDIDVVDEQCATKSRGTTSVGSNLYNMLRYLKDPEVSRPLWIDAICINQEDLEEKSEQIRRMRDIFFFADRTIIWIGDGSEDSIMALFNLDYIGKQIEYLAAEGTYMPSPSCSEREWYKSGLPLPLDRKDWNRILALLRRPYFERLWVLQELQMANQESIVQCGGARAQYPWSNVRRGLLRCFADREYVAEWAPLHWLRDIYNAFGVSGDLTLESPAYLFEVASMRKCSDPKDKIFGLLGLLPHRLRALLKTQYESTVTEIYKDAFLKTVEATQRLVPLDRASQGGSEGYPSWNLSLDQPRYERFSRRDYSMAASNTAAQALHVAPDQLHVIGILQGSIIAVWPDITVEAKKDYLASQKLFSKHFPHVSEENILEACVWVITMGALRERLSYHSDVPTVHEAREMLQNLDVGNNITSGAQYSVWYMENLRRQQPGRFFVTDQGLLGCGASGLEPGDKIAVLLGYDYPVVIRPVCSEAGSTRFQHIGPAYVHGIMEGQAILGPLPFLWTLILSTSMHGSHFKFHSSETGENCHHDPRLGDLPDEWEPVEKEDEARLPYIVQHYRNKNTGEIINSDPRLAPEALRARGVKLETLTLV